MKKYIPKISDIEIIPFNPKSGHLGFASCVIDGLFRISDLAIFSRPQGGVRIGYPHKKLSNGASTCIFKPLNIEIDKAIEKAISKEYEILIAGEIR